jgi:hypothetical protein
MPADGMVSVFVKARFADDCANTLECLVDGTRSVWIVGRKIYDTWMWEQAPRSFMLKKGVHRLTLGTCEDGLEFERVVIARVRPDRLFVRPQTLASVAITPAPEFESFPPVSHYLPEIGGVSAQAFSTHSLVIGRGHVNSIGVYLRKNRGGEFHGTITVGGGPSAASQSRAVHLGERQPSALMRFDMRLAASRSYFVPVRVTLRSGRDVVFMQQLSFVSPLPWAFLGPFADPTGAGLDLETPADAMIGSLQTLPYMGDVGWRVVTDGSCYDDFGLVDLNKVFGFANKRWEDVPDKMEPMVAYGVTFVGTFQANHAPIAFGADDCMQVWVNGKRLLRHEGNAPIETVRQVVGVALKPGQPEAFPFGRRHPVVFKVPQTGYYWHILMEPDESFPYGRPARFDVVPALDWRRRK